MKESGLTGNLTLERRHILIMLLTTSMMAICLVVPFPSNLIRPGFSSFVVLQDPIFVVACSIMLATMWFLWFRAGENAGVAVFLVIIFSVFTLGLWVLQAPGGYALQEDSVLAGAVASEVIKSGNIPFSASSYYGYYVNYPSIFVLATAVEKLSGSSLAATMLLLDLMVSALKGLFYYLVIRLYVKSQRSAVIGTIVAIIADEDLLKLGPFTPNSFGIVFFLVAFWVAAKSGRTKGLQVLVLFALTSSAMALTYPLSSFAIVLILVLAYFLKSSPYPRLFWIAALSYVSWLLYMSNFLQYGQVIWVRILTIVFGNQISSSSQPFDLNFLTVLESNISSVPYYMGMLIPIWFIVFFIGGFLVWLVRKLRNTKGLPATPIVAGLLITGILLLIQNYPAGNAWPRVLDFLAPFLGASIFVSARDSRRQSRPHLLLTSVFGIVLLLTLPTIVADNSLVGVNGARFDWEFAGANFLGTHLASGNIYIGDEILSFNFTLNSRIIRGVASGSPFGGSQIPGEIRGFYTSYYGGSVHSNSVLSVDYLFFKYYERLFGPIAAKNALHLVENATSRSDLIYSTNYLRFYAP